MKSGKRVLGIMIVSLLLVSSIGLVSAGFWGDLFGDDDSDLEGELAAVHDVAVGLTNVEPTIEKFIGVFEDDDTNDIDDDGSTSVGKIVGDAGGQAGTGVVNVRFKFVVEDLDNDRGSNAWDLPGMTGGDAINPATNLIVTFTNPSSNNLGMSQSAGAGDCAATDCFGDSDCDDQSVSTNQVKYTCDIDMDYNDPRSTGALAADLWTISVTIVDTTSTNSDAVTSGASGFTALADNYIDYWTIQGVSVPVSTELAWGTLDINTVDNPADGPLVMDNAGNIAVVSEDVTARNLQENGAPANQLLATAFAASDTLGTSGGLGACSEGGDGTDDGMDLVHNIAQEVAVGIAYTGGGIGTDQGNMYYCIWPAVSAAHLTGSPATSYVANNANSNEWGIDFKSA